MSVSFHATTICAVRHNGHTAMAGDGQVTMGEKVIMKGSARKVRRIYDNKVVVGFAGSVADAFNLEDRFEKKLNQQDIKIYDTKIEDDVEKKVLNVKETTIVQQKQDAMESKRLGLCQKSMFVVPNHLIEQWGREFLQLYTGANILVATKKDFEPLNRKKFCSRIATGDFDAVIIRTFTI